MKMKNQYRTEVAYNLDKEEGRNVADCIKSRDRNRYPTINKYIAEAVLTLEEHERLFERIRGMVTEAVREELSGFSQNEHQAEKETKKRAAQPPIQCQEQLTEQELAGEKPETESIEISGGVEEFLKGLPDFF